MSRKKQPDDPNEVPSLKAFDDFDLRLGDTLRGERATLGKSLLDVQRELRIKANHIAAIENSDLTAFETQSFVAGYVRSYARYLGLEPDEVFGKFVEESGFQGANGMSRDSGAAFAAVEKARGRYALAKEIKAADPLVSPGMPFTPNAAGVPLGGVDAGAVGSTMILGVLIAGLGYGAWSVLQQVQKVVIVPVNETPGVVAELDPLAGVAASYGDPLAVGSTTEALDRLYRPAALDVPVVVARDGPIFSLDPDSVGALLPQPIDPATVAVGEEGAPFEATDAVIAALRERSEARVAEVQVAEVQVTEEDSPAELAVFTVSPAWVRVTSTSGTVIFEKILEPGEHFTPPRTDEAPLLRAGNSGAVFFVVNGETRGPVGTGATVVQDIVLGVSDLIETYPMVADPDGDTNLLKAVAVAEAQGLLDIGN